MQFQTKVWNYEKKRDFERIILQKYNQQQKLFESKKNPRSLVHNGIPAKINFRRLTQRGRNELISITSF